MSEKQPKNYRATGAIVLIWMRNIIVGVKSTSTRQMDILPRAFASKMGDTMPLSKKTARGIKPLALIYLGECR